MLAKYIFFYLEYSVYYIYILSKKQSLLSFEDAYSLKTKDIPLENSCF